jgi:hypothetical protein
MKKRTIKEIEKAIEDIYDNEDLTFGYREDVIAVLRWVLGGDDFDGMGKEK